MKKHQQIREKRYSDRLTVCGMRMIWIFMAMKIGASHKTGKLDEL